MKLKLKEILDNPFRDLATNPLLEEKLVELMSSINLTGFWENVVVRKNARGKYELAYGHHRLRAAIKAGVVEADFIVKDFSDAKMIQVMDSENRETYGSTPLALIETVEAIVEALENGSIPPFTIEKFARPDTVRYAPSFIPGEVGGNSPHMAYTAMNIANFLGRTESRGRVKGRPEDIRRKPEDAIVAALNFLYLRQKGQVTDKILIEKDRNGGNRSITTNELLHRTNEIKRDVERVEVRTEEVKKANEADAMRMRELQAQVKAREDAAEAVRQVELDKLKAAREAEDKAESDRLFLKMKAQGEAQIAKNLADKGKLEAIELRVAERKRKEEEARNEDAYAPIRRDVERALFKMDSVSTGSFCEDIKSLAKRKLSLKDRQRLWESASALADWYGGWVCSQFVVAPDQLQPKRGTISKRRTK